jgi:hypothetical protein
MSRIQQMSVKGRVTEGSQRKNFRDIVSHTITSTIEEEVVSRTPNNPQNNKHDYTVFHTNSPTPVEEVTAL